MELYEFYPKIFEKKIPLNLLEITSRNYSNWKKENLLYNAKKFNKEEDEKREKRQRAPPQESRQQRHMICLQN